MECKYCGIQNAVDAKFCKSCGENLNNSGADKTVITDSCALEKLIIRDRFKIIKRLGKGGMGDVLLAEDLKLRRLVAIKSIIKSHLTDSTSKIRFLREAQTASQLDHTNICTIYEIYDEEENNYIVMQYIDGVTLDQVIGARTLSINKIVDIAAQICNGMSEAHACDIMHRDIKPGNIMIDKKGTVKILDFGLAKFAGTSGKDSGMTALNLTEKGFVMGTVAYISPEQAKGKALDSRTDIFSFGVLLYEMIEGRSPFKSEEQIETLYNVLNKTPEVERNIPDMLKEILFKALEKDKEKRYADFDTLGRDLEAFRVKFLETEATGIVDAPKGHTEIINFKEKEELLKEIQKTSDKEDLGALVSRIKKFKASTERMPPTRLNKKKLYGVLALSLVIVLIGLFLLNKLNEPVKTISSDSEMFYIYLSPFLNKTNEEQLPRMLEHLLIESLGQFPQFKVIDQETARSLNGGNPPANAAGDLDALKEKYNVKFLLGGTIKKENNFYTIDAVLKNPLDKADNLTVTSTGASKDSLMTTQVELITRKVFGHLFRDKKRTESFKRIYDIYGKSWQEYADIYTGIQYYKKNDSINARVFFEKANNPLISRYYLSDINHFDGKRKEALELIQGIMPSIDRLTPALQLKVKVIEARLIFKPKAEIEFLKELVKRFPFSSDVYYQLGEAYFHMAAPREAITYYSRAVQLNPTHSQSLNHLGYCYAYLGNHADAGQCFQKVRNGDQSANSFDSLGDGYYYSGDLVNTEAMKRRAVQPDEGGNVIWWPFRTLGDIYIIKARYQDAEKALEKYKELQKTEKSNSTVMAQTAYIRFLEHQFDDALKRTNQALEIYQSDDINDNTGEIYWLKGLIQLALNDVEGAGRQLAWLDAFINKYKLNDDKFKAAYKYYIHLKAVIAEKENRPQEADQHYRHLLKMKDRLSYWITQYHYQYFHTQYAAFLVRTGKLETALTEIENCLEFNDPYTPYIPALWVKAEILEKLGRADEARGLYERLDELYGPSTEQNRLRNLLKTKLNATELNN